MMSSEMISNSLTRILDEKLSNDHELDQFIDNLEDEIFGISNRVFYQRYKGDIKEILEASEIIINELSFESELLASLIAYSHQRKSTVK